MLIIWSLIKGMAVPRLFAEFRVSRVSPCWTGSKFDAAEGDSPLFFLSFLFLAPYSPSFSLSLFF